jgi:FKBP-type peptidyl-prolyl cis-trans isomerase SlyD
MKVSQNTVVTVNYHLHANLPDKEKTHIESTDAEHPFVFLFGGGNLIAGFERELDGLSPGDKFDFTVHPSEGYGEMDNDAVINLPIDIFKVNNAIDFSMLKVGNVLPMSDDQGNTMNGKVVSYDDKSVKMDFNHPLAGQTLHFSGEVTDVREATQEEISHGHVHSHGDHHHH